MSKIYLPLSVFPFKQTCGISESVRFADIIASNNQFVQQLVNWAFPVQHTEWLRQGCWLQGVTIGTRSLDFKMGAHCARQVDYRTSTLDWPTYASITYSRQKSLLRWAVWHCLRMHQSSSLTNVFLGSRVCRPRHFGLTHFFVTIRMIQLTLFSLRWKSLSTSLQLWRMYWKLSRPLPIPLYLIDTLAVVRQSVNHDFSHGAFSRSWANLLKYATFPVSCWLGCSWRSASTLAYVTPVRSRGEQ